MSQISCLTPYIHYALTAAAINKAKTVTHEHVQTALTEAG